ncbi:MAG: hypothetical protein AAF441_04285 [Pseudomonadota bacterium]
MHSGSSPQLPPRLTDLNLLDQGAAWARFIEETEAVHHRDLDAARQRLEERFGLSRHVLWKWRHRPPLSVDLSEFVLLASVAQAMAAEQANKASQLAEEAAEVLQALIAPNRTGSTGGPGQEREPGGAERDLSSSTRRKTT